MTQAFNLSQLANGANTSGQLNAASYLYNQVPVANGGTALSSAGAAGNMLMASSASAYSAVTVPTFAFRNRIMNGNMVINQRNVTQITTSGYLVDRWQYVAGGSGYTANFAVFNDGSVSQTGPSHLLLATSVPKASLAAGDVALFVQNIEGLNVQDLKWGTSAAKPITISFRAALAGGVTSATVSVSVRNTTSATRSYVTTVAMTNVAQNFIITVPGDTAGTWAIDNNIGMILGFTLASGTTYKTSTLNSWQSANVVAANTQTNLLSTLNYAIAVTDVQLERGSIATAYDTRSYTDELLLCQRYFCGFTPAITGYTDGSTVIFNLSFPVSMRTSPTISTGTQDAQIRVSSITYGNFSGMGINIELNATGSGFIRSRGTTNTTFSAEF